MQKKCSKCHEDKLTTEFYKGRCECKSCFRIYSEKEKEKLISYRKEYYLKNKAVIREKAKIYDKINKEKNLATDREYRIKNAEKVKLYSQEHYKNNKQKRKEQQNKHYTENKEQYRKRGIERYKKNKKDIDEKRRIRLREKYKNDSVYRITNALRCGVYRAIKTGKKIKRTLDLLGCSVEELKCHIESQFEAGMTWDNWSNGDGFWNLDHIKPVTSFDFSKPESWEQCFHYTNLQPLWWRENVFEKRDKINYITQRERDISL